MALRCKQSLSAYVDGRPRVVRAGALVQDDDPIVKNREHLFEPVDAYLAKQSPVGVEEATAAPGEKRSRSAPPSSSAKATTPKAPGGGARGSK
ncbi:hypothetical protein ACR9VJ_18130 [Streptomyces sp. H49]|uniref:hypothetical protein n=1 Tax=Streptomyces sp. H49 TaxID=3444117 RepID=UPI003F4A92CF